MVTARGALSLHVPSWCHEVTRRFTVWSLFCRWRNRGTEKLSEFATVAGWGGPGPEQRPDCGPVSCPQSHAASIPGREDFLQGNPAPRPLLKDAYVHHL